MMEPGLGVDVQTLDQGLVHVHLGPLWFLDRQEADLKPGDEVTIREDVEQNEDELPIERAGEGLPAGEQGRYLRSRQLR